MRVFLTAIGCRLNQAEMDHLARHILGQGHQLATTPAEADLCVLNTCAVTGEAERKSRQAARRLGRSAPRASIVLTGCYATLSPQELASLPGVSHVVTNSGKESLLTTVGLERRTGRKPIWNLAGGRTRAFVKVQDGCDNRCTFCASAIARGPAISRPAADIIAEIQALTAAGYQEVVLTGVNLGSYGMINAPSPSADAWGLSDLVRCILADAGIPRLRLSSVEPWDLMPAFFELWQDPRLCRQLHLPLQSGSAAVLERMGRRATAAEYRTLATRALDGVPGLALTTDIMVGFPGETDAEFRQSLALVNELDFARLHVFGFSARPGTPACLLPGRLPDTVIQGRSRLMRRIGQVKQRAFLGRSVGLVEQVLWESRAADGTWWGHTDNYIRVSAVSPRCLKNTITPTLLTKVRDESMLGEIQVSS